jgi:hypothetical protein
LNKNRDLGFKIKSEDLFFDFRTNFARLFHFCFENFFMFCLLFAFIDRWKSSSVSVELRSSRDEICHLRRKGVWRRFTVFELLLDLESDGN